MRYLILVLLNLPLVLLALVNILTLYKMHRISARRFSHQLLLWLVILVVLVSSFPLYNLSQHRRAFDSSELSSFDIVQTTAIVFLIYAANDQRRRIERLERTLRDLHQEVSIILSEDVS